jgi:hypothetical protein
MDWFINAENTAATLQSWLGAYSHNDFGYNRNPVAEFVRCFLFYPESLSLHDRNIGPDWENVESQMERIIRLFDPIVSVNNGPSQIAIYENAAKRSESKRLSLKTGRALRRMFSDLPDSVVDSFVDQFRRKFTVDTLTLHWGESRKDFRDAYDQTNSAYYQNIDTNHYRKSMASSCMRYSASDFDGMEFHPAESYASGEFKILTARLDGKIAGRVVVRIKAGESVKHYHAPLYGCSELALNTLQAELDRVGSQYADECNGWNGARLLRLECDNGIAMAYHDCDPGRADDMGDYLRLSNRGEYHLNETQGYIEIESRERCAACGDRLDSDEMREHDDSFYCECCFDRKFSYCDCCEEYVDSDDMESVYRLDRWGNVDSSCVCTYCRDQNYTEITAGRDSGDYWRESDTQELANGDIVSQRDVDRGNYRESDYSNEYFDSDDMGETESGEYYALSELAELGWIEIDGIWFESDPRQLDLGLDSDPAPVPVPALLAPVLSCPCMACNAATLAPAPVQPEKPFFDLEGFDLDFVPEIGPDEFQALMDQNPEIGILSKQTGKPHFYFMANYSGHLFPMEYDTLQACIFGLQCHKGEIAQSGRVVPVLNQVKESANA